MRLSQRNRTRTATPAAPPNPGMAPAPAPLTPALAPTGPVTPARVTSAPATPAPVTPGPPTSDQVTAGPPTSALVTEALAGSAAAGPSPSGQWAAVARLTVPGEPGRVAEVRRWLAGFLASQEAVRLLVEDSVLVVSEMVSNAVLHTRSGHPGGEVAVLAAFRPDLLRLEVTDQGDVHPPGPQPSVAADPDQLSEGGRGLEIVAALATEWGISGNSDTSTVWAKINIAMDVGTQ